jgi:hypothetical protein
VSASVEVLPEPIVERPRIDNSGFVVSRAAEAQRLVAFIMAKGSTPSRARFVVLSGPTASGKSVLVSRWLLPVLRESTARDGYRVCYAKCGRLLPDVLSTPDGDAKFDELLSQRSIMLVDEFDRVFNLPRDQRREQLDTLFAKLEHANPDAIVVVVVSDDHLTGMYALSSYDPGIVNAVCEIKPVGLADGLEQLSAEDPTNSVSYSRDVLQRLHDESQELERRGIDVTFDLLKLLRDRFRREARETGVARIDIPQYEQIGGLVGVVREHVNRQVDALESARPGSESIARAILDDVLAAQSRGASADFSEIASRFEASDADVRSVLAGLTAPEGLLVDVGAGQYQFQPPQVTAIIEEDAALLQLQNERALRIVEEGLRSRQQIGTFLPPARFAEIHRQRHRLVLDDEKVRFLVQCAIRDGTPGTETAEYWLRRVASRDDAMDILLTAAFDTAPDVRERVASLLRLYPEPLVRDRLCVLALTDAVESVRAAAVASLAFMADDELLQRLLQEVRKIDGAYRRQAIEALRIFPRGEVASVLLPIVRDPQTDFVLRDQSVRVLAALNIGESVDALIDIALNDSDWDDREAAAKALAGTTSDELNRRILTKLSWKPPTTRIVIAAVLMAIGLAAGARAAIESMIGIIITARTGLAVALVLLSIATGLLLRRMRDGRIKWRSPAGIVGLVLFAICAITVMPLLHGLAHVMVRRWRRAFALFGLELAAIFMYAILAGATEFVPVLGFIAVFYRATGVTLFVASYLYDVLAVAFRTVLFRRAMTREERRSAIYRETFHNPAMADAVFADVRGTSDVDARRAKRLIRQYGGAILPAKLLTMLTAADASYRPYVVWALRDAKDDDAINKLEVLAPTARRTQQFAIAAVLSGNPTARSIAALYRVAAKTGLMLRVIATAAALKFRLSVWPWSVRLAILCLVPALVVMLYHATMIIRNPAWSEIISLRRPLPNATQKAKIVNFLVDAYPRESVPQLRELYEEGRTHEIDPLHAALVRGLVVAQDSIPSGMRLRNQLADEAVRFDSLLRRDSLSFLTGLDVLRAMARSSDSVLARRGVSTLVRFANDESTFADTTLWRNRQALRAIGGTSYARALPTLDSLLKSRVVDKVQVKNRTAAVFSDMIRDQIVRTARQANASVSSRNSADRAKLFATLNALEVSAPELTTLKREAQQATIASSGCDRNADGVCDGNDEALRVIAENPASEDGYRDLESHFNLTTEFRQATDTFELLKGRFPNSLWPRKVLAEIDHESRSATDTAAFARAFDEMTAMRKLAAYDVLKTKAPEDYVRVESDFVEVALTAKRYAEAESVARGLLAMTSPPVDRLNMALFVYIGAVMRHDRAAAATKLSELEATVRVLPRDHYNNWVYPGTLAFIARSDLAEPMKQALRRLCKEGQWYTPEQAAAVISENRSTLSTLSQKS